MRELIENMNNTQQNQPVQQNQQQFHPPANMYQNQYQPRFQPQYNLQPQYNPQPQYQPRYNNFTYRGGCGGCGRGGRSGRGGRGNGARERRYCWTHGLCNHNRRECNTPGQGHQPEATLENHMGGNMHNVNA